MVRQVPWPKVVAEGAAIVLSILLAFAIQAWWEDAQERERENEVLESLTREFEANKAGLPRIAENHRRRAQAADDIIHAIQSAGPGRTTVVADSLLFRTLINNTFQPASGALTAVLQSGDLRLIEDRALREALAAWPAQVEDAKENEDLLRYTLNPEYRRFLMTDVDIPSLRGSSAANQLRWSTELLGLLDGKRSFSAEASREMAGLAETADSILVMLALSLESR